MSFLLVLTTVWSVAQPLDEQKQEGVKSYLLGIFPHCHPQIFDCQGKQCVGIGTTDLDTSLLQTRTTMEGEFGATIEKDDVFYVAYWEAMGRTNVAITKSTYF